MLRPFVRTSPNIVSPTMLGVAASLLAVVYKRMRQLPEARNSMQQGVQTDATCNIQQCWELLAKKDASVCKGLNKYIGTEVYFTLISLTFVSY